MTTTTHKPRRFGFKRWLVIGLMVLGGYLAWGLGGIYKPVSPAVVLPPEPVWPGVYLIPAIPGFLPDGVPLSNTLLSVFIADLILLVTALLVVRGGRLIPSGFYNFFELLVEFLWNMTESAAGKWAKKNILGVFSMFSIMATIFLLVFTANMVKLLPGFESIGWMKAAHEKGYAMQPLFGNVYALDGTHPLTAAEGEHAEAAPAGEGQAQGEEFCSEGQPCEVVPFLRATATDLNFTFALAVTAFVFIQIVGFSALGLRYLGKFINTGTMISKPIFGFIDFGVGLLELVSEFAKILSFGFRLFGNIFAGALLLAILGSLTVVVVPSMLYGLELFVGIIQAYVFSMLTLTFMSQAVVHHGGDHEEHGAGHAEAAAAH